MKISEYLIIDSIGSGGFGTIFRGIQGNGPSRRIVALKLIKEKFSSNEVFKTQFLKEIKTTFKLSHPNIVQVYNFGEEHGRLFCAMEYVEGKSLRDWQSSMQRRNVVMPIPLVIHIILECCKALHYAHNFKNSLTLEKEPLIHRDVSPHNILISFDGQVKLVDFGMAKIDESCRNLKADKTQTGLLKGKPAYMSPEYIRGSHYDHRIDQFALGVIFWEMLTHSRLFDGKNNIEILRKVDKCEIPLPRFHNQDVSHELQEIVLKCLNHNYRKRFSSLEILHNHLLKLLYAEYPDFSPPDLKEFIHGFYHQPIEHSRDKLKRLTTASLLNQAMHSKSQKPLKFHNKGKKSA